MPKKYTLKDDTDIFAKELNLNPKDYKAGDIIIIALENIKSSDNPLVMERIEAFKKGMEKASINLIPIKKSMEKASINLRPIKKSMEKALIDFKPHFEQAKKDKPIFDILSNMGFKRWAC